DRVLDAVGDQRVGLADVEAHVEDDPLADLALLLGDPVVRVERQADDLDGDADLRTFLVVVVIVVVVEVVILGLIGHVARLRQSDDWVEAGGGAAEGTRSKVAAVTLSASATSATSWTRNTDAPRSSARTQLAMVAGTRSATSRPVIRPR